MASPHFSGRKILTLLWVLAAAPLTARASANPPPALTNWQVALDSFQKAGALLGREKIEAATRELTLAATNLPAPYAGMAARFRDQFDRLPKPASARHRSPKELLALAEFCATLHAYDAAIHLQSKAGRDAGLADDSTYAWRLWESGDLKSALAEYQRRLAGEPVDMWKDHYRKQIKLIEQRAASRTNAPLALEVVQQHYLNGYEEKADPFGALRELTHVLPSANRPDAIAVHKLIIKLLTDLDDAAGRDAWEEQLLALCPNDAEVRGEVFLERGLRAYRRKELPEALTLYRKVCVEYPTSSAYGDAQYSIGYLLQEQQKYDEAVAEYSKLFSSSVNDYAANPEDSDDFRNYRYRAAIRISECYEAKHDLPQALKYAELARDQYKFLSYCKNCLRETQEKLTHRIEQLQAAAKKPE